MGHRLLDPEDRPAPLRVRDGVLLALVVGYGMLLRTWDLPSWPLWVDEAESAVNALTILDHGLPIDHYLGLPIFENTLTRPWPDSAEYEFRDSSYSDRGLAIYHGWLPLYSIAASYWAAGVTPDQPEPELRVRHGPEEITRRTLAARVPSVLFGLVFLLATFFAARAWFGPEAGWAALAGATVCTAAVSFARQARYYSATLALAAVCAWLLARIVRRGRWRDYLLGAAAFVLLFHTNVLAFLSTAAAAGLLVPLVWRQPRLVGKLALAAVVVAAGTVPWALLTGFSAAAPDIPKARTLMTWKDMLAYPRTQLPLVLLAAGAMAVVAAAPWLRGWVPRRLLRPLVQQRAAFVFCAAWALIAFGAFTGFIPAASYFYGRLTLMLLVPGLLFGSALFAAVARALLPRAAGALAAGLLLAALWPAGQVTYWWHARPPGTPSILDVVEVLRRQEIRPGTRIYADGNDHLILTLYTGLPVQKVAPVRKEFLDRYPGEVLILEIPRFEWLKWWEIQRCLQAHGRLVSEAEARRIEERLPGHLLREQLRDRVRQVTPPLDPLPEDWQPLLAYQQLRTIEAVGELVNRTGSPMFRGFWLPDYSVCWQVFFYRFVHPEARTGPYLNYADRIRDARAQVLPWEWVLFHCPARPAAARSEA